MNKKESLALYEQGREAWNVWANNLLAERAELEANDEWESEKLDWEIRATVNFSGCDFENSANFRHFVFPAYADFDKAKFSSSAYFGKATFSAGADFSDATFSADANFTNATFSADAYFEKATFSADANFSEATFSANAHFTSAKFEGLTLFKSAHFIPSKGKSAGDAYYIAIRVTGYFSLQDTEFAKVPDFTQAHFQQAPSLNLVTIETSEKPENFTPRWRTLRRLATQGHDHENEKTFFAREIQSRRDVTDFWFGKNWQRRWFGHLYEFFSDFGRSVWRPFAAWIASTLAYFLFCYANYELALRAIGRTWTKQCLLGDGNPAAYAFKIAFDNALILPMFGASDGHIQENLCLFGNDTDLALSNRMPAPLVPDWVACVGFLHALFCAAMIFLVLLALRNQFRIR